MWEGFVLGYIWRSTEYLIDTENGILHCCTVKRRAEDLSYDPECVNYIKITHDDYVLKGARTTPMVYFPTSSGRVVLVPIPFRGRDFVPRRLCI